MSPCTSCSLPGT